MRKVKFKNVKELYDDTCKVSKPKAPPQSTNADGGFTREFSEEKVTFQCLGGDDAMLFSASRLTNSSSKTTNGGSVQCTLSEYGVDQDKNVERNELTTLKPASQCPLLDLRDQSDYLKEEVKLCDTCGDVGWEELLATCSRCSDGAEHTYCMCVKLEKVPKYWICEECILKEEKEKRSVCKLEQVIAERSKAPLLNNFGKLGFCNDKNEYISNETHKGHLAVVDNRRIEGSAPCFSATRPFSSLAAVSQIEMGDLDSSKRSSKHTNPFRETVMSQGSFLRSKTFSNLNTRVESQLDYGVEIQYRNSKEKVMKVCFNSASFRSTSLDPLNVTNSKVRKPPSNLSIVEDLKRSNHEKEQSLFGSHCVGESHKPSEGSVCSASRSSTFWMPAVPELKYIWKGGFAIQTKGRPSGSCDGIQAHLSTRASSTVLHIVHECPPKILLEKVPRLDIWPTQFLEEQATEDNIALYFFAKDLESYKRNYRSLLDFLVNDDLCLKGSINGVELLIFSSNLLPERSQRWNNYLFLWGVLKGISSCPHDGATIQQGIQSSSFTLSLSNSHNLCSSVGSSEILSSSLNIQSKSNSSISSNAAIHSAVVVKPNDITSHQKSLDLATSDGQLNAPMKHKNPSREIRHNNSFQRDSKGRLQIDLNKESDTNGPQFGEERESKRMRSFKEVLDRKCFEGVNILHDGFAYNLHSPGNIEVSHEAYGDSICSEDLSLVNSTNQKPGLSDEMESGIPSLELSLGSEKKPAKQGAVFSTIVGYTKEEHNPLVTVTGDEKDKTLLSLSPSLPTFGMQKAQKRVLQMSPCLPRFHSVDTSLSLSCVSRNY